jgi:hypothetical protein
MAFLFKVAVLVEDFIESLADAVLVADLFFQFARFVIEVPEAVELVVVEKAFLAEPSVGIIVPVGALLDGIVIGYPDVKDFFELLGGGVIDFERVVLGQSRSRRAQHACQ